MKIEFDVKCTEVRSHRYGNVTTTLSFLEPKEIGGDNLVADATITLRGDRMKVGAVAKVAIKIAD